MRNRCSGYFGGGGAGVGREIQYALFISELQFLFSALLLNTAVSAMANKKAKIFLIIYM